ncbi:MAG TPA: HAMP domain-containing histidine kinase [Candidatus Hungatella pullicola]|nr:HAMP domain-containing histidine kinase [Candidatus Hungatella pullicola]
MKHSIKTRFTAAFVCLMAVVLVATWCVNSWFLEDFYTWDKVRTLERAYLGMEQYVKRAGDEDQGIVDYYRDNYDSDNESNFQRMLRVLVEQYNMTLVLLDTFSDEWLMSNTGDREVMQARIQAYIFGRNLPESTVLSSHDNYIVQRTYNKLSDSYYLESWGYFSDNRTVFLMSIPLASIQESVDLSNRFLAGVGVAALLLGSIFIYLASKRMTAPILELSNISEKMSNLDFDAKYTGTAEDEIGILGNSMNKLSDTLKDTIGQLQEANKELQKDIEEKIKVDEMRKDFIANVSHELKTPIALIQGYAEGLTEGMAEDPESRDYYCEVIMDEANKMNKMVRQLLTLTALEFGNDTPVMEVFDLTALVKGVLNSANILIQQKNANVRLQADGPIWVKADEFKIEEVVTNYLNNALNHLDGERNIVLTVEGKDQEALVTVFNNGHNIPEEDLPNLWVKFFKVDKAHTREYGGSGIGLSIVKAIMDSHHKSCGVRNVDGGVEFWFTLDASSKPEEGKQESSESSE